MEEKKVTRSEWKRICEQLGRWCAFEEIENLTYAQAVEYVKNMSVWTPQ